MAATVTSAAVGGVSRIELINNGRPHTSEQVSDQTESDQQPDDAVDNDVDTEHPSRSIGEDRACHRDLMLKLALSSADRPKVPFDAVESLSHGSRRAPRRD